MLDTETKRRIDTARDILVGKLPDPKSQVEQITIALIYKFMDDMDSRSEELGGERTFFDGDFQKYGWARLMRGALGGHEMLGLYSEAITRMPENPGIPPLFRDIFKNAYLPYRDPETLRAFLKIIDDFEYDHSERLGDAFEYLLSVLGSQGDAGQFRTPRHIIDFIVSIVDPKKDETVLDPACGTAGFLISAYKHILKANTDADGNTTLTPADRERLAANFRGYDISPDMVRLSLVNMYLHGFADPQIHEYDTLSSQDRWNEHADVVLANPPFMSPRGGIQPHNRFSVQSKRSEVLFVDYIAEHLTPTGRAGIIVPEGIIFQSQTAYRQLRKLLVEESLVAVISLPAGVFNPYSGVKTSILILDRAVAKQSATIGFFKIANDGFGLGAQRRTTEKNDLPQARAEVAEYLRRLRLGQSLEDFESHAGLVVPKDKIQDSEGFALSGDRYGIRARVTHGWRTATLSEVCTKITDGSHNPPQRADRGMPLLSSRNIRNNGLDLGDHRWVSPDDFEREDRRTRVTPGDVLLTIVGTVGRCVVVTDDMPRFVLQRSVAVIGPDSSRLNSEFLLRMLQSDEVQSRLRSLAKGVAQMGVYLNDLRTLEIPLPPLETQIQVAAEVAAYQTVIDSARSVLDHYRPMVSVDPMWPLVDIGEVCELINGRAFKPSEWLGPDSGGLPIIRIQNLNGPNAAFNYFRGDVSSRHVVLPGDVLFSWSGSRGTSFGAHLWPGPKAVLNQHIFKVGFSPDRVDRTFLLHMLNRAVAEVEGNLHGGVGLVHITKGNLERVKIPMPPLAEQRAAAAEVMEERPLVDANHRLILLLEEKIRATLRRVWVGQHHPRSPADQGPAGSSGSAA